MPMLWTSMASAPLLSVRTLPGLYHQVSPGAAPERSWSRAVHLLLSTVLPLNSSLKTSV